MKKTTTFKQIYQDLSSSGQSVAPRGQMTLELTNYTYTLPPFYRFAEFPSRPLNYRYIKEELKWYFRGDIHDLSICQHAKIWKACVTDGALYSNYGHYLFEQGGLRRAIDLLLKDPDSRRAVVPILNLGHLSIRNNDVPCTVSIAFRGRDNILNCTVHMRSQDAVFGMANDVPFFSLVQEIAAASLGLELGFLTVFVESLHVYEWHFELLSKVIEEEPCVAQTIPRLTQEDAVAVVNHLGLPPNSNFGKWLSDET